MILVNNPSFYDEGVTRTIVILTVGPDLALMTSDRKVVRRKRPRRCHPYQPYGFPDSGTTGRCEKGVAPARIGHPHVAHERATQGVMGCPSSKRGRGISWCTIPDFGGPCASEPKSGAVHVKRSCFVKGLCSNLHLSCFWGRRMCVRFDKSTFKRYTNVSCCWRHTHHTETQLHNHNKRKKSLHPRYK
jgi:hypothetical protein